MVKKTTQPREGGQETVAPSPSVCLNISMTQRAFELRIEGLFIDEIVKVLSLEYEEALEKAGKKVTEKSVTAMLDAHLKYTRNTLMLDDTEQYRNIIATRYEYLWSYWCKNQTVETVASAEKILKGARDLHGLDAAKARDTGALDAMNALISAMKG